MRLYYLAPLLFLLFISCSTNPYDTSTPKNFVISLGKITDQPKDHNPLPYFYDEAYAEAILAFDQAGEKGLDSFDKFRSLIAEKFPKHIKTNREGQLKVSLDSLGGFDNQNFNYSVSMVGAQMKERKPSDYEFVSASEPDDEGILELKIKILGRETTIPLKNTADGYRMFSTEATLDGLKKSIAKINEFDAVFSKGVKWIESGELSKKNFKDKIEVLSTEYFKAIQ